ncbi:MAG: SDR family NAD(P)-dependent oxidoreductase [Pseudoxanthomonas sp.]|nr:SDR family NAD(P)-dependent oxidoreductase [Pseudoxanthomonas sp.]
MNAVSVIVGLDTPANVLVTGASSGIGLAVVRQLLANDRVAGVFALSRHAETSPELAALQADHGERLQLLSVDLTSNEALASVAGRINIHCDRLHLVFSAAGVLHAPGVTPEKSLTSLSRASLESVFALNAFAPVLLAQALAPLLRHDEPAVFASLSARVGSIGDNQLGGWYAYRASKAAQNQLLRTLAVEWRRTLRNACVLLLHPGTVDTPLSRPFQANVPESKLFTPERAARQLLDIVAQATPANSGCFVAWDGSTVPW